MAHSEVGRVSDDGLRHYLGNRAQLGLTLRHLRAGEVLLRQGEPSEHTYIVVAGLLEASEASTARRLAWHDRGQWVGELGVLTDRPRAATVRAWTDAVVLELGREQTLSELGGGPKQFARLARHVIERSRPTTAARPTAWTVCFVPLSGVDGFGDLLRRTIAHLAGAALFTSDPDAEDLSAQLLSMERAVDGAEPAQLRLLLSDPEPTAWSHMAVRSADQVVIVDQLDRADQIDPLEQALKLATEARSCMELLLSAAPPAGDSRLSRRDVEETHILHSDLEEQISLLLRRIQDERGSPLHLRRFPLCTGLDPATLTLFRDLLQWRSVRAGEVLIEEGSPSDGLYLLKSGRLGVHREHRPGDVRWVNELGAGEFVGELASLQGERRIATVVALRDSRVGFLSAEHLDRLLEISPQLGRNVARVIASRLSPDAAPGYPRLSTLAVVPLDDTPLTRGFMRGLGAALSSTLQLSVETLDGAAVLGDAGGRATRPGHQGHPELIERFHRMEQDHDIILLPCRSQADVWSTWAVDQADRVICVGDASGDRALRPIERFLLDDAVLPNDAAHLVLLQPEAAREGRDTASWLSPRAKVMHHHVRAGNRSDLESALRRIMNSAVGLSFGGAGSRGPAHIGVFLAMKALGLPVDMLAGTSSGGIVAASLSAGLSIDEIIEGFLFSVSQARVRLWQLQPPVTALTNGQQLRRVSETIFGARRAEDQLLPCALTAVDLRTHSSVFLQRGRLSDNLRAAVTLPVYHPPMLLDGQILVDGGMLEHQPITPLQPLCQHGLAVLSDLGLGGADTDAKFAKIADEGYLPTGWEFTLQRWRGKRPDPPITLTEVLHRCMCITSFQALHDPSTRDVLPHRCRVRSPIPNMGLYSITREQILELIEQVRVNTIEQVGAHLEAHPQLGALVGARSAPDQ